MRDGWTEMTLGDMAEVNPETTKGMPPQQHIRYIDLSAVSADSGIDESAVIDYELRSAPGRARRVVRHGDVLVSTVRPYLRGFAVVPESLDGAVASTGFTVLRARKELSLPGFVWSIVSKADFADRLMERATGSNYPAVRPNDIAEQVVLLPPLVVQRRVVDLVDAVDTYAAAAGRAAAETRRALDAHLEGFDTWTVSDGTALGDLASMGSGPSWKAEQERSVAGPGTLPVVKITNTRPDGRLVMDERAFVADLPASTGVLDEDSLVMIRTNGNRDRIGNVYRSTPETVGHAVSAFQIAVHPFDPADSAYLFWYLRSPRVQRLISEAASGTTGLGNVAVRWLRQLEVPWPDASTRAVFVDTAEAMLTASESASNVGEGLSGLRSALLGELLSGEREVPGSYDELMGLVA